MGLLSSGGSRQKLMSNDEAFVEQGGRTATPYSYDLSEKPADLAFLSGRFESIQLDPAAAAAVDVLDVGCGDHAQAACFFASKGANVVAIDIAESACKHAAFHAKGLPVRVLQALSLIHI